MSSLHQIESRFLPLEPLLPLSLSAQNTSLIFLSIMESAGPKTYHEAIELYQAQYDSAIKSGTKNLFIIPQALFGYVLLFTYLLVFPVRFPALRQLRYGVFLIIVYHSISTMRRARTMGMNYGIGVGLCSSWCILWSATFLIFKEPHKHLSRIKRLSTHRTIAGPKRNDISTSTKNFSANSKDPTTHEHAHRTPVVWERMPNGLLQRVDWIFDLLTSLRGLNWSWNFTENLPLPGEVVARYQPPSEETLWFSLSRILLLSLCLDIIKVAMMVDPYFWGFAAYPTLQASSMPLLDWVVTSTCRSVLSFAAIYVAVIWIYALVPLICVHLLGPHLIGVRGEEWMYPSVNGTFSAVLHGGLHGFWGKWWHQLFRLALDAGGSWATDQIQLDKMSTLAWLLRITVAFAMSGFVHACGSYTQWPDTQPLRPFLFFILQPIGIGSQRLFAHLLQKHGVTIRLGEKIRCAANLIFTLTWLWTTFPLLADDFARGGLWLAEPLPISPLRALGAISGERLWWCWQGQWWKWHAGGSWWQSGVAIL